MVLVLVLVLVLKLKLVLVLVLILVAAGMLDSQIKVKVLKYQMFLLTSPRAFYISC